VTLDDETESVPAGFERLPQGLGFTDNLQPVYRRIEGEGAAFGLIVTERHCNTMGICHGGVLMTLSDITATTACNLAHGVVAGSPTVHIDIDFIAAARRGEWIQAVAEKVTAKRRFGFSSGGIYNSEGLVARFAGTVYFPDHKGLWKSGAPGDGVLEGREA
jgi:uncharacterized protein (TIGR00369 family)